MEGEGRVWVSGEEEEEHCRTANPVNFCSLSPCLLPYPFSLLSHILHCLPLYSFSFLPPPSSPPLSLLLLPHLPFLSPPFLTSPFSPPPSLPPLSLLLPPYQPLFLLRRDGYIPSNYVKRVGLDSEE